MKNTLSTASKLIAIGDRKATIEIAIGDLFLNCDRDRDLKFDKDRDRDSRSGSCLAPNNTNF